MSLTGISSPLLEDVRNVGGDEGGPSRNCEWRSASHAAYSYCNPLNLQENATAILPTTTTSLPHLVDAYLSSEYFLPDPFL